MTGQRYARGSRAWGECQRSGKRVLLKDMVQDPLTGLLVAPDWAEQQLPRPPVDIVDGVSLYRPAPDLDQIGTTIDIAASYDLALGEPMRPLSAQFELGVAKMVVT